MTIISRDKMLKKYRFLTNTTEAAVKKMLPVRELLCSICNQPITDRDAIDNCEAVVEGDKWRFFHKTCIK